MSDTTTTIISKKNNRVSVFEHMRSQIWPYRYRITLAVDRLVGGVPTDKKVTEGWIKSKIADDRDDLVRDMVAQTLVERGMAEEGKVTEADIDEAIKDTALLKNLNGFKRDASTKELLIEGRQIKAMIKEAANVKWPKERWGKSSKGTRSYFAEHLFVEEDFISLGTKEPDYINQTFVHTWRGTGIQLQEVVEDTEVTFHLVTDHKFSEEEWATLWLTAEQQGLGAARSQSYGKFAVIEFEEVQEPGP